MNTNLINKTLVFGAIFSLALVSAFSITNQASAESLLVTCTAETQSIDGGAIATDQAYCSVPSNSTITRAVLDSILDDGGAISINNNRVYTADANIIGIKTDTRNLSVSIFSSGQGFLLDVNAQNSVDGSSNPVGPVYGKAVLKIYGDGNTAPPPVPPTPPVPGGSCVVPTGLSPTGSITISGDSGYANLSWGSVPDVASYNVRLNDNSGEHYNDPRFTNCGEHYYCVNGVNGTSIANVPVKAGRTYSFWVDPTYNPSRNYCNGNTTFSVSKTSTPPPVNPGTVTADIKANGQDGPVTIAHNTSATISWTSTNATSCTVTPGGWTGTSGSQSSGNLTYQQTYTVNCNGAGGFAYDSVTVNVGAGATVTADIKANGQDATLNIPYNTPATISWTSTNASSCNVSPSGWTGTSGSQSSGNLTYQQTYTVYCAGQNGGNAQDSVTVTVGNPPQITADIKANGQDGPITIPNNSTAIISWTSSGATSCNVSPGGWTGTSGSQTTPSLSYSTTYYLSCTGASGYVSDSVVINVQQVQAPTVTITSSPSYINQGQSSILTWSSQNATYCIASSGWSGNKNLSGSETVYPGSTTTYSITCYNSTGQSAVAQTTVTVNYINTNYPSVTLTSNPSVINRGQSSMLNWNSQNTTSCYASGGYWSGNKSLVGSETVYPNQTTTYYINCTGQNGQNVSAQTTVFVNDNYNLPTVNLTASPTNVNSGQQSTLYWNSQNATTCYATAGGNNWSGNQNLNGSSVVYPTFTTTYTITCTNQYGQATDTETITVNNYGGGTARNLQVTKSALNRNLNQSTYSNSVEGQGLDVMEFEIRVRNIDNTAGSVNVQDVLPQELYYVPNSTSVNGINVADGITGGGLYLGTLNANEEKIIRFRAVIFAGSAQKFITNQVNATMNSGVQNAYATIQIKNRGQVLGAADIVTGPENPVPWVLSLGLLVSVAFYFAAFKFHVIKLAGPVLTPYEKIIYSLRAVEKAPDTNRARHGKNVIR